VKKAYWFQSAHETWIEIAEDLHRSQNIYISKWIGDPRLSARAANSFGKCSVVPLEIFRDRPHEIESTKWRGELSNFFLSENYLRAKDRCLKLMDRIDDTASFSRINREAVFHNLCIWALTTYHYDEPEILVSYESPHNHIWYLIYEIFIYDKKPIIRFGSWPLAPLIYPIFQLGEISKRLQPRISPVKTQGVSNSHIKEKNTLREDIKKTLAKRLEMLANQRNSQYEDPSLIKQQELGQLYLFLKKAASNQLSLRKKKKKGIYDPILPMRDFWLGNLLTISRRRSDLKSEYEKVAEVQDPKKESYVYFPLHFEPERTTLPDGGLYHDQFIALTQLRAWLPQDIAIYVREHPSQFFWSMPGYRGRSPLFYKSLRTLSNVVLIDQKIDSYILQKNAMLTATVTGSAALESVLLGKPAIIFGDAWYANFGGIFKWRHNLELSEVNSKSIPSVKALIKLVHKTIDEETIVGYQNPSSEYLWKFYSIEEIKACSKLELMFFFRNVERYLT
jgi:hypothetical protein